MLTLTTTIAPTEVTRRVRKSDRWRATIGFGLVTAPLLASAIAVYWFVAAIAIILYLFLMFCAPVLIGLFVLYLIWTMIPGAKRTVLVLRRFGRHDTTTVLTRSLERRLNNRYRFVTLDDADFPRIGVPKFVRRIVSSAGPLVPALAVALPVAIAVSFPVVPLIGAGPILGLVFAFGLSMTAPLIIGQVVFILVLLICFVLHRVRIRRRARVRIATAPELQAIPPVVGDLSSRCRASTLMAPQSTLVTVATALWQDAVKICSEQVDVIVIDVSELTANLVWELQNCLGPHRDKCILIADRNSITTSLDDAARKRDYEGARGNSVVLTYEAGGPLGPFAHNLGLALDNIALARRRANPTIWKDCAPTFRQAIPVYGITVAAIYLVAFIATKLALDWSFADFMFVATGPLDAVMVIGMALLGQ